MDSKPVNQKRGRWDKEGMDLNEGSERWMWDFQRSVNSTTGLFFWSSHFEEKSPGSEKYFLTEDPSKLAGPHKKPGLAKSELFIYLHLKNVKLWKESPLS